MSGSVTKKDGERMLSDWARIVSTAQVDWLRSIGHDGIELDRDGCLVRDELGRESIDCTSSGGIHNLGRRPAEVAEVLRSAMREVDQGNFPMISREKAELGRRLAEFLGGDLECSVFSVVRGESFDFACKLARGATGRKELLVLSGSYFGQTGFALSLSERRDRDDFEPLIPETGFLAFGDLDDARARITRKTAAVFVEPVQAENGCRVVDPGYLRTLRALTRSAGALLVVDETQTGLGRTGRRFAYQHAGIDPDMVIVGESLGAGMFPIAATSFTQKLNLFLNSHPLIHLSTFGGSDIGCVVARRALDLYEETSPWDDARERGERLRAGIEVIRGHHPAVRGLSGVGLLVAVFLDDAQSAIAFCRTLAENGVLALPGAVAANSVVFRPPLTITANEIDRILTAVEKAAGAV